MSFKDNLLKKININNTSNKVIGSIGPPGSELKVDKDTIIALEGIQEKFDQTRYRHRAILIYDENRHIRGRRNDELIVENRIGRSRTDHYQRELCKTLLFACTVK